MMRSRFRPWLLGLLLCSFAAVQASDSLSASDRLEQARQKLVDQVMQAGVRVDAISWLDASGRLHEHQSMRQSIDWLTPLDQPRQAVRDLLSENPGQGKPDAACLRTAVGPSLYATLGLSVHWPERLQAGTRERLEQAIRLQWMGSDDRGRNWRMFRAPVYFGSTYQQRLQAPPAHDSEWQVQLQLELLPAGAAADERLQLRLSLSHQRSLMTERQILMDLQTLPQAWGPAVWAEASWQRIEQQLTDWADLLDHQLACTRPQPRLEATPSGGWQLNMGRLAGMHVGDEWALIDPAWLPDRALEPGAIGKMVVARVVRLDDTSAEIMTVAGDVRQVRPGWSVQALNLRAGTSVPRQGLQQARR